MISNGEEGGFTKPAERAEISRRYLQQIEAGTMNPTINVIIRLRGALEATWDEMCEKL